MAALRVVLPRQREEVRDILGELVFLGRQDGCELLRVAGEERRGEQPSDDSRRKHDERDEGKPLEEVIDYLNAHGEKVGLVKVRLYRPFSVKHFVDVLPESVKKIALQRMDDRGEP